MSLTIIFTMIGGSYSGEETIPSPGRVFGALLSGAYASGDDDVIDAVRSLAHGGQPDIVYSTRPNPFTVTAYSSYNLPNETAYGSGLPKNILSFPWINGSGKRGRFVHWGHLRSDDIFAYVFDTDVDADLITRALDHVGYLGLGHDFACGYVADEVPEGTRLSYNPDSRGGTRLRMISPELLHYYDVRHSSSHRVPDVMAHLPEGSWKRILADSAEAGTSWVTIASKKPVPQRRIARMLSEVSSDHPQHPIALIDQTGSARGVAVAYGDGHSIEFADDTTYLDPTISPALLVHDPDRWTRRATSWVSATPLIGHPDPAVVVWELERQGFTVTRIESDPWHVSQGRVDSALTAPSPYKTWWIQMDGDASGSRVHGMFTNRGAGVFRPLIFKK